MLFDIIVKLIGAMQQKNIPFSVLIGYMHTYQLVTQLKAENPYQFKDIVPILDASYHQISYIYAIYAIGDSRDLSWHTLWLHQV